ncbi:hypothetical protein [Sphingomonas sp. ERG5]|uniref:hypothetical protein n=1 Tax=Sphingomonas sp. ERG5 TaxID=1381597 RepID=UPI00054B4854|nr:hypothetical protein [Sphingomonas sp. ERG5]
MFDTSPIEPPADWPESWRIQHDHDDVEIRGSGSNPGFAKTARLCRILSDAMIDAVGDFGATLPQVPTRRLSVASAAVPHRPA